jgi:hypothetical protein
MGRCEGGGADAKEEEAADEGRAEGGGAEAEGGRRRRKGRWEIGGVRIRWREGREREEKKGVTFPDSAGMEDGQEVGDGVGVM